MIEATTFVRSKVGLHARPAASFVKEAQKYRSTITIESAGRKANGKSIFEVLALGTRHQQEVVVRADGPDEEEAVKNLTQVLSTPEACHET